MGLLGDHTIMKTMKQILLFVLTIISTGCINNDVPYPIVEGQVLEFEAQEQKTSTIDLASRTVTVDLKETADPAKVKITKLTLTDKATTDLDTIAPVDMSAIVRFDVVTYQTYNWKIVAKQTIERKVKIKNQVGEANIDALNKKVILYVPDTQDLKRIQVQQMKLGPENSTILPNPLELTNFSRPQIVVVRYRNVVEEWTVYVFPNITI